jgi:hypothetical protein
MTLASLGSQCVLDRVAVTKRFGVVTLQCFKNDPTEIELVFIEFRPIDDDRVVGRGAEPSGRYAAADRVRNVSASVPGERILQDLRAAVTMLRSISVAAAVGIGTLRQIVAVWVS